MSANEPEGPSQSFGAAADLYDRARPSYPDEAIDALIAPPGTPRVLDVGCGTGILSRLLVARGCDVLGVEPDGRMAAVARGHGLTVEESTFETWDPAGRPFDLVVAGMSWHWVDGPAGAMRAGDALRPGGGFAALWNFFELPSDVRGALLPAYARHAPTLPSTAVVLAGPPPRDRDADFDADADALLGSGRFARVWREQFTWPHRYTTSSWVDELATRSSHRTLPDAVRAALLAEVAEAVDGLGGGFDVRYTTSVLRAVSRSSGAR